MHILSMKPMKYFFGRHGSFQMRYGWLTKGFRAFNKKSDIFTSNDATALLGVGKNMVSSIKYRLNATKIINNKIVASELWLFVFVNSFKEAFTMEK